MNFYGDKLRLFRESKGLTQDELARRIQRTRQSIDNYEHGKNKPSPEIVYSLRRVLGCSIYDLSDLKPEVNDPALIHEHLVLSPDLKRIIDIVQEWDELWQSKAKAAILELQEIREREKNKAASSGDPGELLSERVG